MNGDQVVADTKDGTASNRQAYANEGPYKYVDPDGWRIQIAAAVAIGFEIDVGLQHAVEGKAWGQIGYPW